MPAWSPEPASQTTRRNELQGFNSPNQVAPWQLSAFFPTNQTMLWGSTPTRTGRRWKKISSRQPTRTKVLAGAIESLEDPAGGGGGGLDPAMNASSDRDMPAAPRRMASKSQDLVEAQAHGQGGDGELLLLGQGELDGLEQPVPELGVLAAEGLVLSDQFLSGGSAAVLGLDGGQDLRAWS